MTGLNFHDEMVTKMGETSDLGKTYTQSYNDWLDKHDRDIRADERRKFAEWLKTHCNSDGYIGCGRFDELLAYYGKEQKFFDIWKDNVLGNKDDLAIGLSQLEEEIRADERRKFAFWLINRMHRNSLQRVLSETNNFDIIGIDSLISIYEKEQKNENQNNRNRN